MRRTSLSFTIIALLCLFVADIEILTLHPWEEVTKMGQGALTPNFKIVWEEMKQALLNTVTFALCGIFLGVVLGTFMAFFFRFTAVRLFCAFLRSIHEIFWAFIFMPIVGLNSICGVLAIAIPYAGVFAKVYSEILQEADHRPLEGLPPEASGLSRFFYAMLPVIYADIKNYTSYRFECALRSSAILGFIGLPTLGFHLETAFREGHYSEAAALLYCFYLLIASLKYWMKPKLVLIYVGIGFALISKEMSFSWTNVIRFFTYEILPWPMRRDGFYDGSYSIIWDAGAVWEWAKTIFWEQGWPGLKNTVILTQIALVGTGIFTLVTFPFICRHFAGKITERCGHYFLIVMRTTPEYILAYLFVQLWGPSMLPAIVALALHNGAILGFLTGQNANLVKLEVDSASKKIHRYFFEILPRVYGQFLAFLFYRWEIIMRESAILGLLGVFTLGFYIDSAISNDQIDTALFLILMTAVLNMTIDTCSQMIRKRLKVSTKLVTSA